MLLVFKDGIFPDGLNVLDFENFKVDFVLLDKWQKSILLAFLYGIALELIYFVEVLLMAGS